MNFTLRATLSLVLTVCPALGVAHSAANAKAEGDRVIDFPDVQEKQTLVVDLHTHSVFSDGHVWPKIRVEESIRDGLDAMAVTEHLEYQPHRADILHPDRNRSFAEAAEAAKNSTLLVISGSEITREAPAGHMNAIFVEDSNKLLKVPADAGAITDAIGYYKAAHGWPADEAVKAANATLAVHSRVVAWRFWPEVDFPRTHTMKVKRTEVRAWASVAAPLPVTEGP
jgi:uncharacterized protein (DUF2141 family)